MVISRGQHRLQRVQLVNWGTFHGAFDLPVPRKGLLVTGPSGSGKSSLLDAMATVLVQPKWLSFNAAAQEGGTGDRNRSLVSYVRGAYKRGADEATGEVATTYLRSGATWSAIALTFDDAAGSTTSLIRLMHLPRGSNAVVDVNSLFVIADEAVELAAIGPFAENGLNARQLRAVHPDWVTFPTYQAFAARMQRRLGLASDQAQRLLHKTQSAKNLTSLDALLRDFMLDEPETFADVERAVDQFGELSQAHAFVVDARRQVEVLGPLRGIASDLTQARGEADTLTEHQAHLNGVHFELRVVDTAVEIARLDEAVQRLEAELSRADAELDVRRAVEAAARRALDGMGGADLQRIEEDSVRLLAERETRQRQRDLVSELADAVGLTLPQESDGFTAFLVAAETARSALADTPEVKEAVHRLAATHADAGRELRRLVDELTVLERQRSNMDVQLLAVRDLLADSGLDRERLRFVGELLDVRAGNEEWRGAIERVLRSFARTLLVPADSYPHVSDVVDSQQLGARLVYERVPVGTEPGELPNDPRSLVHKVDIADSESADWVAAELNRRFDYLCVASAAELRAVTRGVTRAGQIRHSTTRHEKDDRRRIDDRTSWVLGTSVDMKREALEVALDAARTAEASARTERDAADEARAERAQRASILDRLRTLEWGQIDVVGVDRALDELRRRAATIRASHTGLAEAERQLAEAVKTVAQAAKLRDGAFGDAEKARDKLVERSRLLAQWRRDLAAVAEVPERVRQPLTQRLRAAGADLAVALQTVMKALGDEAAQTARRIAHATNRAERMMSDYKRDWPGPAADWAIQVDYLPDFLERLDGLEADRLPDFEDRFFTLLQNQSRNNIGSLKQKITSSRREIRERVDPINASLRMTEFSPERYLVVKVDDRRLPEVTQFLAELDEITAGSFDDTFGFGNDPASREQAEARFVRMQSLMRRLGSTEPPDIRWRQSCLDTRQHVKFVAEVRDLSGATVDVLAGAGGLSGGERQKLVVFCLAAALRYQLARGGAEIPTYGLVVLDEAFDKTDPAFTRAGLEVFRRFEFQLLLATPLKMLQTLEDYVGGAAVVRNTAEEGSHFEVLTFDDAEGDPVPDPSDSQEALL
jgi:uncharacterized protein YPO0396